MITTALISIALTSGTVNELKFDDITYQDREPILVKPFPDFDPWEYMIDRVKESEGFYPERYKCCGGVLTIGYGHTQNVNRYSYISKSDAEKLLRQDLRRFREYVNKIVDVELNPFQEAALTSFCFNVGPSNLKRLVDQAGRLNDGNYDSIRNVMPKYRIAGGKVRRGLVKRRNWEVKLFYKMKVTQ